MNILVTGAWNATPEQLRKLQGMGHQIFVQPQEAAPLGCPYEDVEGTICNGLFLSHPIERFVNLKYIQLTSAGFDRVPMEYVQSHGIEIHNARGVYSIPMAEHALAGVLALYRHLGEFQDFQNQRKWEKIRNLEELFGRSVLIIGCGNVGTEIARRFAAMGCRLIGVDIVPMQAIPPFADIITLERLDEQLSLADIVVLTLPLTPATWHLLDARRLRLLKDHAVILNIARGGVIDQTALTAELVSERLRAVLDVLEMEPLDPGSPLWEQRNVLLTPHNSFAGDGVAIRLAKVIFQNLYSCN